MAPSFKTSASPARSRGDSDTRSGSSSVSPKSVVNTALTSVTGGPANAFHPGAPGRHQDENVGDFIQLAGLRALADGETIVAQHVARMAHTIAGVGTNPQVNPPPLGDLNQMWLVEDSLQAPHEAMPLDPTPPGQAAHLQAMEQIRAHDQHQRRLFYEAVNVTSIGIWTNMPDLNPAPVWMSKDDDDIDLLDDGTDGTDGTA